METDYLEITESRQLAYGFLSSVFLREVSTELLDEIRTVSKDLPDEMIAFSASLNHGDAGEIRSALAAEFASLFLNMSSNPVAMYESVYLSDLHLTMQEPYVRVVEAYHEQGVGLACSFREPADHIGVEFAFMAMLCRKAAQAAMGRDSSGLHEAVEAQERFMREHVSCWVSLFCDALDKRAVSDFYRGVSRMTREYIELDAEYLAGGEHS